MAEPLKADSGVELTESMFRLPQTPFFGLGRGKTSTPNMRTQFRARFDTEPRGDKFRDAEIPVLEEEPLVNESRWSDVKPRSEQPESGVTLEEERSTIDIRRRTVPGNSNQSNSNVSGSNESNFHSSNGEISRPIRNNISHKKIIIRPQTYDGTGSIMDYQIHFEICSEINEWTQSEKSLHLAGVLKGDALSILSSLQPEERRDYNMLMKALFNRFLPPNPTQMYRAELRARRRHPKETLPELGQAIRRRVTLAYPTATLELQDVLSKDAFFDALQDDSELVWRVQQSRPASLDQAVQLAVEFEAFALSRDKSSLKSNTRSIEEDNSLSELHKEVQELKQTIIEMKTLAVEPSQRLRVQPTLTNGLPRDQRRLQKETIEQSPVTHSNVTVAGREDILLGIVQEVLIVGWCPERKYYIREEETTGFQHMYLMSPARMDCTYLQRYAVRQQCLLDTGSSPTLLSRIHYESIPTERRPRLRYMRQKLKAANGKSLKTYGLITAEITIGEDIL